MYEHMFAGQSSDQDLSELKVGLMLAHSTGFCFIALESWSAQKLKSSLKYQVKATQTSK